MHFGCVLSIRGTHLHRWSTMRGVDSFLPPLNQEELLIVEKCKFLKTAAESVCRSSGNSKLPTFLLRKRAGLHDLARIV